MFRPTWPSSGCRVLRDQKLSYVADVEISSSGQKNYIYDINCVWAGTAVHHTCSHTVCIIYIIFLARWWDLNIRHTQQFLVSQNSATWWWPSRSKHVVSLPSNKLVAFWLTLPLFLFSLLNTQRACLNYRLKTVTYGSNFTHFFQHELLHLLPWWNLFKTN